MVSKIDIQKFGIYNDFQWKHKVGNSPTDIFKRINIIYGRNYSGKTTLARIFKCIEDGELHRNCPDGEFSIQLQNGQVLNQKSLKSQEANLKVRVYNSDFIKGNLSWLHNEDGSIKPFTILGERNIQIDKRIKEIEDELGAIENGTGLLSELATLEDLHRRKVDEVGKKEKELGRKLTEKASQIRNNALRFNETKYQIKSIEADIANREALILLSAKEIEFHEMLLTQNILPIINKINESKPQFTAALSKTIELISRRIKPTEALEELLNDSFLQEWVRQGIEKHKGKRTNCGFCGHIIDNELWKKLDNHFSKESEDLRLELQLQINALQKSKEVLANFLNLKTEQFYNNLQNQFDELFRQWNELQLRYSENLSLLIQSLQSRLDDIFQPQQLIEPVDVSEQILLLLKQVNQLIQLNNNKYATLVDEQKIARTKLRLSELAQFIKDIDYDVKQTEIRTINDELIKIKKDKTSKQTIIDDITREKFSLEAKAKNETKGPELVNEHLSKFFGHDELKLKAEGDLSNLRVTIYRGSSIATNLSEGECSLISFCYFIARMEDEMKDEANNHKLVIYIDDPISSLDNNHIFFIYSLIETIIAKPKKYGQLFISTHNLDFLKYLKRITTPDGKESIAFFLIERCQKKEEKTSRLVLMPNHIKEYVTEFNFLFNEIYCIYKEVNGDRKRMLENTYNQFYNLPNNLRKFLECYLFYKYPNTLNPLENLSKLFDGNTPSLINRVINEYSHLTYIDRGWKPIDVDEAETCVKLVIDKIKEKDEEQFEALVESLH